MRYSVAIRIPDYEVLRRPPELVQSQLDEVCQRLIDRDRPYAGIHRSFFAALDRQPRMERDRVRQVLASAPHTLEMLYREIGDQLGRASFGSETTPALWDVVSIYVDLQPNTREWDIQVNMESASARPERVYRRVAAESPSLQSIPRESRAYERGAADDSAIAMRNALMDSYAALDARTMASLMRGLSDPGEVFRMPGVRVRNATPAQAPAPEPEKPLPPISTARRIVTGRDRKPVLPDNAKPVSRIRPLRK